MKNTRKGFTLVELIVVITILAILGSIAFVSLQGYSADARNSKRTSDLNSLQNAMSVKSTEGVGLLSFVTGDSDNQVSSISIGGTGAIVGTNYQAGIPNYSALGVKQADFQDPLSSADYRVWATTKKLGQYELAASMEQGSGNRVAKVIGNYTARGTTVTWTASTTEPIITLSDSQVNYYYAGDLIGDGTAQVISISADGKTITLNSTGSSAALAEAESNGLIDSITTSPTTGIVLENGAALPY